MQSKDAIFFQLTYLMLLLYLAKLKTMKFIFLIIFIHHKHGSSENNKCN